MIKDLEIGGFYKIILNRNIWRNEEVSYNLRISGITKKNSTEIFGSYSVKEELFQKLEIGMNTYLKTYTDEIDVYVCNLVTSVSPLEFDEKEMVFIPKSAIDFTWSEKLLLTYDLAYNIEGINCYPEEFADIDEIIKDSITSLKQDIKFNKFFVSPNLTVTGAKTEIYKPESDVCAEQDQNAAIYSDYLNAQTARILKDEETRNNYLEGRLKYEKTETLLNQKIHDLEMNYTSISQQQNANIKLNQQLAYVSEKLRLIVETKLIPKGEQLNIHVPTYEELLREAEAELGGFDKE